MFGYSTIRRTQKEDKLFDFGIFWQIRRWVSMFVQVVLESRVCAEPSLGSKTELRDFNLSETNTQLFI